MSHLEFTAVYGHNQEWIDIAINEGSIDTINNLISIHPLTRNLLQDLTSSSSTATTAFLGSLILIPRSKHDAESTRHRDGLLETFEFLSEISENFQKNFLINLLTFLREKSRENNKLHSEDADLIGMFLTLIIYEQQWKVFDSVVRLGSHSNQALFSKGLQTLHKKIGKHLLLKGDQEYIKRYEKFPGKTPELNQGLSHQTKILIFSVLLATVIIIACVLYFQNTIKPILPIEEPDIEPLNRFKNS
jgi:hypothetical protein